LQKLAESVYKRDSDRNSDPKALRNVLATVPGARKEPATAPSTPPGALKTLLERVEKHARTTNITTRTNFEYEFGPK